MFHELGNDQRQFEVSVERVNVFDKTWNVALVLEL